MLLEKWEPTGLLASLSLEKQEALAIILEELVQCMENRVASNIYTKEESGQLATFIFPLAHIVFREGTIVNAESLLQFLELNFKTGALESLKQITYRVIDAEVEFIRNVADEYMKLNK